MNALNRLISEQFSGKGRLVTGKVSQWQRNPIFPLAGSMRSNLSVSRRTNLSGLIGPGYRYAEALQIRQYGERQDSALCDLRMRGRPIIRKSKVCRQKILSVAMTRSFTAFKIATPIQAAVTVVRPRAC